MPVDLEFYGESGPELVLHGIIFDEIYDFFHIETNVDTPPSSEGYGVYAPVMW